MSRFIATFFYIGLLRPAPGTWGSAAAIPVAYLIHATLGPIALLIATITIFFIGLWATGNVIRGSENQDPSEVVIDEVVGQWIPLVAVSFGLSHAGVDPWVFPYPGWVTAFIAFRLFDIWKPGPVGWADRRHGAMGVMLDDVIAGLMAAVVVMAAAGISHGLLGL